MENNESKQPSPEQEAMRTPLLELHGALLKLHKALLDSERLVYEKTSAPSRPPITFFSCSPMILGLLAALDLATDRCDR